MTRSDSRGGVRRLRSLAVSAASLLAVSAVAATTLPTPAAASTGDGGRDPSIAAYAQEYGVDPEEAQRRLGRLGELQALIAAVRAIESSRLAGWGVDHQGGFTAWILLVGEASPTVGAVRLAADRSDLQIRTGASYSLNQLLAGQRTLMSLGATGRVDELPGPADPHDQLAEMISYTGIDMENNAVRVGIDPPKTVAGPVGRVDDSVDAGATFETAVAAADQLLSQALDVSYRIEDGRGISSSATLAGGQAANGCTTGFAAQHTRSQAYGIVTAGHCGDDGPNETRTLTVQGVDLPHVTGWAGVRADAQFNRLPAGSSHSVVDDYLCSKSFVDTYCDVSGKARRLDMKNEYICHTGKNSGISCGTVRDIYFQPSYDGACYSTSDGEVDCHAAFVEVSGSSLKGCGGDSGGPWYRRGTAYGIHMGGPKDNPCNARGGAFFFSAIDEVERFLGVTVLTAEPTNIP